MSRRLLAIVATGMLLVGVLPMASASATTDCVFDLSGTTWTLMGDCTTDTTISIPDGFMLDGNGHTITGVDPAAGHFTGAVVENGGALAHVANLTVTVSALANVCDGGADRLRGIMFEGASGSITNNTVVGINQGPSGCQEGNAIEVRNEPFDGTHPGTVSVDVSHNTILDYQKTGIVANGDVSVTITHNTIGASATQENLAANSVQVGFGAIGYVGLNSIEGNQWMGTSDYAASAVLVYLANATVDRNVITGNSDVGIFFYADDGVVTKNKVFDEGADHPNSDYDIGIGNYGTGNTFEKNKVSAAFDVPYDGVDLDTIKNKVVPAG